MKSRDAIERLLERVEIDSDGCWLFKGGLNKDGYGTFSIFKKTQMLAHRASYTIFNGPIPNDAHVLHRCIGKPSCIRPECLYLGDPKQNAIDRKNQGREGNREGSLNGRSKLDESKVVEILKFKGKKTCNEVSRMFGISLPRVSAIFCGNAWKHVPRC